MTIQFANAIVQRLGPCRIALDRALHEELARELSLMGCDVCEVPQSGAAMGANAPSAGFLAWTAPETKAFADALRPFRRMNALILQSAGQDRRALERSLFDAGWQRHAGGMMHGESTGWSSTVLPAVSFYQRAGQGTGDLQKSSVEADAAIARYAMAASHVRPGDHVLIDGAGSTDGAAILSALSRAGAITRVSPKAKAAAWAGRDGGVTDAGLAKIPDTSVDLIVAFEPAVPTDWTARLDDYARILKYDGRLVLGIRQGAGADRAAGWEALLDAISERFLPESRLVQLPITADPQGPHAMIPVALDQDIATDWMFVVAAANPLIGEGRGDGYDHPAFSNSTGTLPALVDFGAAYDNPWLYRSMVQMGERLNDEMKLARLAECVIEDARPDSADRGAAIAVLGYRVLELRLEHLVPSILPLIAGYADLPEAEMPVHVRRWRISLAFLGGRLCELVGDRQAAKRFYRLASDGAWQSFSPLLATKVIAADFYEARLCLADGDTQTALERFKHGVDTAMQAANSDHAAQMGAPEKPLPFYLTELAEVIDMGSQCANAVAHFHLWARDPGLFWRQVDIRRFGLASWARDLEQENQRLRAA